MRIIDADGHVQEKQIPWADLIDAPYRARAPKEVKDNRGFSFVMIDGRLTPKPVGKACSFVGAPRNRNPQSTTGMTDPVQRLKDMDLEGIDTAVLFGTSPFLSLPFVEDKDLASAVARVYNNWLAGYCKADPHRLKGVALTAIQDPAQAVKELRRAVEELKFVAVATPPISASGKNLDHPDLFPFFAEAERLKGAPFYLKLRCDFRGRVYPIPHFNHQRGDHIRSLFLFDRGELIGSAKRLEDNAASCWGNGWNKKTLPEKRQWCDDRWDDLIEPTARRESQEWRKAENPFLFLAACDELVAADAGGPNYETRLPVAFDGLCNGLVHFCALTRQDPIGLMAAGSTATPAPTPAWSWRNK